MRTSGERPLGFGRTVVLLLLLVGVSLLLILLSSGRKLDSLQATVSGVLAPLQRSVSDAGSNVSGFFGALIDAQKIKSENAELKQVNEGLMAEQAQNQRYARENEELRRMLAFKQLRPDLLNLPAQVLGHDTVGIKQAITIDRGEADGVKVGMAILSPSGFMIGQVQAVEPHRAVILLLTDTSSKVGVLVQRTNVDGVLEGRAQQGGTLLLTHVRQGDYVGKGDLIITSGTGGTFPKGLLLGQVIIVRQLDINMEQEAMINPLVDTNTLNSVLVNIGTQ